MLFDTIFLLHPYPEKRSNDSALDYNNKQVYYRQNGICFMLTYLNIYVVSNITIFLKISTKHLA